MKQILCFGDSNTYGLIPATDKRYGWGVRWTSILNEKLTKHSYRVIEEGLCGRTTIFEDPLRKGRRGTESLPNILETHIPLDIVILMLGTNDCKAVYGACADLIGKGIEKLLEQINTFAPLSKVLLVSPIHLGDKVWQEGFDQEFSKLSITISKELDSVYKKIAEERELYYIQASEYAKPSEIDQEHLNEEGHKKLAEAIYQRLSKELI